MIVNTSYLNYLKSDFITVKYLNWHLSKSLTRRKVLISWFNLGIYGKLFLHFV